MKTFLIATSEFGGPGLKMSSDWGVHSVSSMMCGLCKRKQGIRKEPLRLERPRPNSSPMLGTKKMAVPNKSERKAANSDVARSLIFGSRSWQ